MGDGGYQVSEASISVRDLLSQAVLIPGDRHERDHTVDHLGGRLRLLFVRGGVGVFGARG